PPPSGARRGAPGCGREGQDAVAERGGDPHGGRNHALEYGRSGTESPGAGLVRRRAAESPRRLDGRESNRTAQRQRRDHTGLTESVNTCHA
uniref:Uncharacterized protein n=1 Tax=Aegilops tauschii subsp. strangulata TaxID=200361 RepID=A0A453JSN9_AEGTS